MQRRLYTLSTALLLGALLSSVDSAAALRAEVVASSDIRGAAGVPTDGRYLDFESRDGHALRLLVEPTAAEILNPSFDGRLYPVARSTVHEAMAEMRAVDGAPLDVVIYCLPGLPEGVSGSFCLGREIFLSPTLAPARVDQIASTVVHELGHAVHHAHLDRGAEFGWQTYTRLRGLDPAVHHARAAHRDRPREIFAEDFRMLFGGPLANYSGTHENHSLRDPSDVEGLRDFFEGVLEGAYDRGRHLAQVSNHPNPFNPQTTILVQLRPEQVALARRIEIDVFDVRGRRVRSLPEVPAAESIRVQWDGTDDRGSTVASGRYAYRVRVAGESVVGSMLLLQ